MTTSTTKLIAALAISAGLLTTNAALAKGGSGKSGGGSSHSMSSGNSHKSSSFNALKLNSNNSNSSNHSTSMSGISKKNLTLNSNFKKQDFNKDLKKNGIGGITLGNNSKFDKKLDKKFDKK